MSITHSRASGIPNDPAEPDLIGGEDWDAEHVFDLTAADVGAAEAVHTHDYEASGAVATHAAAGDPHTGYRLESADHTHASAGLQGGTIAHSALTGLTTGDPHTQYVQEADANWVDLTDGGATTLHTHAGGSGAPTDADYLVGTANGSLSNEIVVGTSPGGELGGTWASPTVDATHAGSTHLTLGTSPSTQAFGDAAAGGAATDAAKTDHKHAMPANPVTAHEAAGDPHTGYRLESADHTHASTGLQGGTIAYSALTGTPTIPIANSVSSAFVTATTSVSAATYADVTGASLSLVAGTWLVIGQVTGSSVNAHALMHVAITDNANAIVSEQSGHIPASGSANVASTGQVTVVGVVTPGSTTTYKLRAARGNTTLTGTWVAMDGAGIGVTNNLTDNSDKGTGIFAIRIA